MGGKSQPNVQSTSSSPPPQFMAAYENVVNQAQNVAAQPYQPYGGQMVAGFNPTQTAAFSNIANDVGIAQPYLNAAQGEFGSATTPLWPGVAPVNASTIDQYLSPYTKDVTQATQAQFANLNEQQQQSLTGNAIQQGAFGGDRASVAAGILGGQQAAQEAPVLAGIQQQGFTTALQTAEQQQQAQLGANEANAWLASQAGFGQAALGNEAQQTALTGAQSLLGVGQEQQQLAQEQLNVPYEQYLAQQAYPFQTTQFLANTVEGAGSLAGGTSSTTSPGPSQGSTMAGGALSGAAMGAMVGGPWGAAIGGVGGLLAGALRRGGMVRPRHFDSGGGILGNFFGTGYPDRSNDAFLPANDPRIGHLDATPREGQSTAGMSPSDIGALATYIAQLYGSPGDAPRGGVRRAGGGMLPYGGSDGTDPFEYVPMIGMSGARGPGPPRAPASTPEANPAAQASQMLPLLSMLRGSSGGAGGVGGYMGSGMTEGAMSGLSTDAMNNVAMGAPGMRRGGMLGYQEGGDIEEEGPATLGPPAPPTQATPEAANDPYAVDYNPPPRGGMARDAASNSVQPWQIGLLAAGLGILGGRSPHAGVNIGRGGLEGVRAFAQARGEQNQEAEREDARADADAYKKANLKLEAQRFSDSATEAAARLKVEQGRLADEQQFHTGELGVRGREADIAAQRARDSAANEQALREQGAARLKMEQGETTYEPGIGLDPKTGQQVTGSWETPKYGGARTFHPGQVMTGKPTGDTNARLVADMNAQFNHLREYYNGLANQPVPPPGFKMPSTDELWAEAQRRVNEAYARGAQPDVTSSPGGGVTTPPSAAVDALKANPALRDQFEQKYGPGSADPFLKTP